MKNMHQFSPVVWLLYRDWQDPICIAGAGGLGVSLVLIHIYVAPLKRFLQILWAAGVIGGISIMTSQVACSLDQPCVLLALSTHRFVEH